MAGLQSTGRQRCALLSAQVQDFLIAMGRRAPRTVWGSELQGILSPGCSRGLSPSRS